MGVIPPLPYASRPLSVRTRCGAVAAQATKNPLTTPDLLHRYYGCAGAGNWSLRYTGWCFDCRRWYYTNTNTLQDKRHDNACVGSALTSDTLQELAPRPRVVTGLSKVRSSAELLPNP